MAERLSPEAAGRSAFPFILERHELTPSHVRDFVDGLKTEKKPAEIFFKLTTGDNLAGHLPEFGTLDELYKRDREREENAGAAVKKLESSLRIDALRRPFFEPSPLEYYFLSLLDEGEWADICGKYQDLGFKSEGRGTGYSVRSIITNVFSDQPRTKAFISAVRHAARHFNFNAFPGNILDIGCGPFPILALAASFETDVHVPIICYEINPLFAAIAEKIVEKLGLTNRIRVIRGDALTIALPPPQSANIIISETIGAGLLDEELVKILPRFAPSLTERGFTIPARMRLSAAIIPLDYRNVMLADNARVVQESHGKKLQRRYHMILSPDGNEVLKLPNEVWTGLTEEQGHDLTKPPAPLSGTLLFPPAVTPRQFNNNYRLGISAEFFLGRNGKRLLERYRCIPTIPGLSDPISVDAKLLDEPPENLQVKYAYQPGTDAEQPQIIVTVAKKET